MPPASLTNVIAEARTIEWLLPSYSPNAGRVLADVLQAIESNQ